MTVTADEFRGRLAALGDRVGMGQVFALARALTDMAPDEIERLMLRCAIEKLPAGPAPALPGRALTGFRSTIR